MNGAETMSAQWTVQSADPDDAVVRRIHLVRDLDAQPETLFGNVMPKTYPQTFLEGDVWGVTFTLISRRGSNGQRQ